jgi:hypothetical protein
MTTAVTRSVALLQKKLRQENVSWNMPWVLICGNFSSIIFDHQNQLPRLLKCGNDILYDIRRSGYDTPSMIK